MIFLMILFGLTHCVFGGGKEVPPGVVLCSRKHPKINDCVRNAIQETMPKFISGIKSLDIPSLDPFHVDNLIIDSKRDDGSPVSIDLSWHNVNIKGIKSAKITSAKADWDNNMVSFEAALTEPVDITGNYNIDGIILILPIKGTGTFDLKLEGFRAHIKVHGKEEMRDGDKYMMVDRLAFTFDIDHMEVHYYNLFNGDPVLGESMNSFLNDNWRDIIAEMTPSVEASFSKYFEQVARKVFDHIPIDKIALP
ncbi:protein takeout-like [Rhodnius prolixus]|uniref:Uncharacterized protein n=1 Tax=Rhodnius prolixus TaxID=13249 RepID=R4G3T2_RHOPR